MKRTVSASLALTLALTLLLPALLSAAPQAAPQKMTAPAKVALKAKTPAPPETIHPAFADLREKTAVIVFLAWLWIIVGILVWLLRMKIREADRVHALKFYPEPKDASRPPTH